MESMYSYCFKPKFSFDESTAPFDESTAQVELGWLGLAVTRAVASLPLLRKGRYLYVHRRRNFPSLRLSKSPIVQSKLIYTKGKTICCYHVKKREKNLHAFKLQIKIKRQKKRKNRQIGEGNPRRKNSRRIMGRRVCKKEGRERRGNLMGKKSPQNAY